MKSEKYYIGLDIGTDSVGYAVTDEQYHLCKFKGEPMWGTTLFEEAAPTVERRGFRTARRRLDRRQQRVKLLQELFAPAIARQDERFFQRLRESSLYPETAEEKIRIFDTYEAQKHYAERYPTIHHLIVELMESEEPHDVRLVYLACAWLVVHRGHFLSEVDRENVKQVTEFQAVYDRLVDFLERDGGYGCPWRKDADLNRVQDILKRQGGCTKKYKELTEVLFGPGKAPSRVDDEYEFNYDAVLNLLCGGKRQLSVLFDNEEYADLEEKSVSLDMEDDKWQTVMQSIENTEAELLEKLKAVFDWSVLADILQGYETISQAKVATYRQHEQDLKTLKALVKRYLPDDYNEIFRKEAHTTNYVAYIGQHKPEKDGAKKPISQKDFCDYIFKKFKNQEHSLSLQEADRENYEAMQERLQNATFMPKQVNGNNRVIPYQLYWHELDCILKHAQVYLPFLGEKDEDGLSVADKVRSIMTFRVPYYVGPLKEESDKRLNHWMVRRASGRILPWNFDKMVDKDASEEAFIRRMTNTCTYLPGEDVLPKQSLTYSAFEVLNEINNLKIDGQAISVEQKQSVYRELFQDKYRVTPKLIRDLFLARNWMEETGELSGIDVSIKSSLKPWLQTKRLAQTLSCAELEKIICRATYSEDKTRLSAWLKRSYPSLPEADIRYLTGLNFKDFGRLSKSFLCGMPLTDRTTGETYPSVMRALWETNCNLMQLLSDQFTLAEQVEKFQKEYFAEHATSFNEQLDDMRLANSVKRPIMRTLDILKDVEKVQGQKPTRIFVEMARGSKEEQKGKRTASRLTQIQEWYKQICEEDVRKYDVEVAQLQDALNGWGDSANNRLQSDKLFLYFMQMGKCLYTGQTIPLSSVLKGDGDYNIEHIYPRSYVKDDSLLNNEILVDSKANGEKKDQYPIDPAIQSKMSGFWEALKSKHLISEEKYRRLMRKTGFTEEERFAFVNRQLVETRQSTKAVAELLKQRYPDAEVVYVKAGLVSDVRQAWQLPKSRQLNDLHHAKDAYLNIVVGNVWHAKFSRAYWRPEQKESVKPEVVFSHAVQCGGTTVWRGVADREVAVRTVQKNTAHLTYYSHCRQGGFFDQNPLPAKSGLAPLKKGLPPERYGGYNKTTASFFVLVRYCVTKQTKTRTTQAYDVTVMPVELLFADRFLQDEDFALQYAKQTIAAIWGKEEDAISDLSFLLNKRPLKVHTVLSLNGFRMQLTGKEGGGKVISLSGMMACKASPEREAYIKRLESFAAKRAKNPKLELNESHDKITGEENLSLYDWYLDKWEHTLYRYRPAKPTEIMVSGRDAFQALPTQEQVTVLLAIQGLFGRLGTADLRGIQGSEHSCKARLSASLSNWKKSYTDVRIVDNSASGLFERRSDNLLDLL